MTGDRPPYLGIAIAGLYVAILGIAAAVIALGRAALDAGVLAWDSQYAHLIAGSLRIAYIALYFSPLAVAAVAYNRGPVDETAEKVRRLVVVHLAAMGWFIVSRMAWDPAPLRIAGDVLAAVAFAGVAVLALGPVVPVAIPGIPTIQFDHE